jgi:DNA (cytosine-5)-methyltransferase 1
VIDPIAATERMRRRAPTGTESLEEMNAVLFAGFGGSEVGIEAAGETVEVAINHSEVAIAVHKANHPHVEHHTADVYEVPPKRVVGRRHVRLLWLSPDCTDHSNAKGGKPREKGTRALAWVGVDWARDVRPDVIMLENVPEFQDWGPLLPNNKRDPERLGEIFDQFVGALSILGYQVEWRTLTACDYGAPTSRKRLFLIARCDGQPIVWPDPTHGPALKPYRTAAEIIDWSIPAHSIFLTKAEARVVGVRRPLADATLARLGLGIWKYVVDDPNPYIVEDRHGAPYAAAMVQTGYGERKGQTPRALDLNKPIGTIMATGQKHAVVAAYLAKHYGDPRRKSGGGVVLGHDLRRPIGTVTCEDHHSLVTATIGRRVGGRASQVAAFLAAYYGTDAGQSLREPLRTITCTDRFGLVVLKSTGDVVDDIAMRMLVPRELLRGQFGDHEPDYDLSAAKTIKEQVLLIGNSVPPDVVEALVRANLPRRNLRRAA